jgi:hypothetical protein
LRISNDEKEGYDSFSTGDNRCNSQNDRVSTIMDEMA